MTPDQVKRVQRALNDFTTKRLKYVGPLIVDGHPGPATEKRIQFCRYYVGYLLAQRTGKNAHKVDAEFMHRLAHPRAYRYSSVKAVWRGIRRRRKQRKLAKPPRKKATGLNGLVTFDGHTVAGWFVPICEWARHTGHDGVMWRGGIVSGYRTPEYSEHLCEIMCGRPTCPGRCAGRNTNHAKYGVGQGAIDVSDYVTFGNLMRHCPFGQLGVPSVTNILPMDRVHFSHAGN